ncbi:ATPase inhibitor A, mitochondrial-like [Helicoverpa zea]|uniref:ATPase inhibitor A, mitochondrial-like n=1 Tax=Helicoverpa zea TaxID=7113 RepID=UPI000B3A7B32|nr:ATPase inhibitor A, mitochondrial [Helicoverpa armigera]XP_047028000.1 ATPase inhibitor A, mitochondrial-like [Helicoverpa zea]PZC81299.1 hypothetical protein B5X24_HaOG212911 [Helicoverpa armigera]
MLMLNGACRKQSMLLMRKLSPRYGSRYADTQHYAEGPTDYTIPAGIPGSGVGKGGGAGGAVRESGGGLGRYGAAQEEGYFHQQQREQIEKLKDKLRRGEEIGFSQKPKEE